MRTVRNFAFVLLVCSALFASERRVLADWGNWEVSGYMSWSWFGACEGWWDCEESSSQTLYSQCEGLCSASYGEVSGFDCYWDGTSSQ